MDCLFETSERDLIDTTPIVLIDKSGSTRSEMDNTKTVLETESDLIMKILTQKQISKCYLMYWGINPVILDEVQSVETINESTKSLTLSNEGTDISLAFFNLPKNWLTRDLVDIIIITDGEINYDKHNFSSQIKNLEETYPNKVINIHIVTVEPNDNNYNDTNVKSGCKIYQIIRENKLTQQIKSFKSYNRHHKDPFVNFYNPTLSEGLVPFGVSCFRIEKMKSFYEYVKSILASVDLRKLVYDLSITLYHLTKSQPKMIQSDIINMFVDLFEPFDNFIEIRAQLLAEISNHRSGQSSTLQEYRENRQKLFERANDALQEDVKGNIAIKRCRYMTLPVSHEDKFVILKCNDIEVTESVQIGYTKYHNAGIKTQDRSVIPVLAMEPETMESQESNEHLFFRQTYRQWIRALYSKLYCKAASDDVILYTFLAQALYTHLMDIDLDIKMAYRYASIILLKRRRYNSGGVMEITHLENGNPPLPVVEGDMRAILNEAKALVGLDFLSPYTLWYGIILMLNNPKLIENQLPYCISDLRSDFGDSPNLLEAIKAKIDPSLYQVIDISDYNYVCYITLEETTQSGGYAFPLHELSSNTKCTPKYVISSDAYHSLFQNAEFTKCPICYSVIPKNEMISVGPKINKVSIHYDPFMPEVIPLDIKTYSNTLIPFEQIKFSQSYQVPKDFTVFVNKMNQYTIGMYH